MSPRLPVVSGKKLVGFLSTYGYEVERQRGSHVRLKRRADAGDHCVTVPLHAELARGTLNDILNVVSLRCQVAKEDLVKALAAAR